MRKEKLLSPIAHIVDWLTVMSEAESNGPPGGAGASGGDAPEAPEERLSAAKASRVSHPDALTSVALSQIEHMRAELERAIEAFVALCEVSVYWRPGSRKPEGD